VLVVLPDDQLILTILKFINHKPLRLNHLILTVSHSRKKN